MHDLTNPTWIKVKGLLFLLIGIAAAVLIVLDNPTWKTAILLALAIGVSAGFTTSRFTSSKNTLTQPTNSPGCSPS